MTDGLPPLPEYPAEYGRLAAPEEEPPGRRRPRRRRGRVRLAVGIIAGAVVLCAAAVIGFLLLFPPQPEAESEIAAGSFPVREENPAFQPRSVFDYSAHSIDAADSLWVVANKQRPLDPVDYAPELEAIGLPGYQGQLRPEAAEALRSMFAAYQDQVGGQLSVVSPYRSYQDQVAVYHGWVSSLGQAQADRVSARPGHSEHQTGLAVDINTATDQGFGATTPGKWLARHSWEYGFVVRYPADKEPITGYTYEPWHFRYVGTELAKEMHEQGITTLEEFFGLDAAPDY